MCMYVVVHVNAPVCVAYDIEGMLVCVCERNVCLIVTCVCVLA